MTIKLLR
ncbi:23adba26-0e59-4fe2-b92b-8f34de8e38f1 [Thermothielavioides terrestris]|nr:23adba26-0e59-4fe2-b92b-8f34de8e38f1 [Thermothielavioides terrestris]